MRKRCWFRQRPGRWVYESERMPWDPDPLTLRVLTNELLETLENPRDAELLKRHVRDGNSLDPGYLAALSPQGRTVPGSDGVTPEEAKALVATLPPGFREDLVKISPSAHVSGVQARLLVMHDRDDPLVPAAESRRLLEATRDRGNVRYTELLALIMQSPEGAIS